jgi:uncharacterized protein (DUF433 family)
VTDRSTEPDPRRASGRAVILGMGIVVAILGALIWWSLRR